ncbi:hypothetical protein NOM01_14370 [Sporolactobacillus sp. STSJ-5]|uniref:hypothetical protein n=1 Tax=Sporolactobacillus sp. STSJ-5 TaxID=2965076 RepID=UPI00210783A6|nr:hypothetical protein [Sporolactobacillus sp. STSJ-5]MCQ2011170.1 hypothetical protein [Sporolactobacillus sp. STSJ-5]
MQTDLMAQSYFKHASTFNNTFSKQWSFVTFEDAGEEWKKSGKFHCQCGRTLKYRYTLKYEGSLDDLSHFISSDEKKEIAKNGNLIYFGETCFGHKILGLSEGKSEKLTKSVQHIRHLAQKYTDDEELKKALQAQRSLIKALRAVHAEIPAEAELMDNQGIPLMKDQMRALDAIHQDYLKKQMKKETPVVDPLDQPDHSWSDLQKFAEGIDKQDKPENQQTSIAPISMIAKDNDFQMKMKSTYDQLPFNSAISAVETSFEIERKCTKSYGYFSSGKPRVYTELLVLLLSLKGRGQIQMISGDTNDFVFKKIGDERQ